MKTFKFIYSVFLTFVFSHCLFFSAFASPLSDWKDSRAYKPEPVLFLHGLNSYPSVWNPAISGLNQLFSKYQEVGAYLEVIDFQDRWGSIDTYSNGNPGWADRLNARIKDLLSSSRYGSYANKLNLVCWSMGGLAAREFLTANKYPDGYVDKLILIGVPNLGTTAANRASTLITGYKIGSITSLPILTIFTKYRNYDDLTVKKLFVPNLGSLPAVTDLTQGTPTSFLNVLNKRPQPSSVKYYGIVGLIGNIMNWYYFRDFYGGDGIVSKDSQLGKGIISFQATKNIASHHLDEPAISASGENPLLNFLDFDPPRLEIFSPNPETTTVLTDSTAVHIQAKIYNEYLPADSQVIMDVIRQEDGYTMPTQISYLQPSDLWVANNPGSPVAEFDQQINLPGNGTYKISCQVKNPAGKLSNRVDAFVRVDVAQTSHIIVHCHNPEGKEIASIQGIDLDSVKIYDNDTLIGLGAYNSDTHYKQIRISAGEHIIKAWFNGMVKEQSISLDPGNNEEITFLFERTEIDMQTVLTRRGRAYGTVSVIDSGNRGDQTPSAWVSEQGLVDGVPTLDGLIAHCDAHYYFSGTYGIPYTITHYAEVSYDLTPEFFFAQGFSQLTSDPPGGANFWASQGQMYRILIDVSTLFEANYPFYEWFVQNITPSTGYGEACSISICGSYDYKIVSRNMDPNPGGYCIGKIPASPYHRIRIDSLDYAYRQGGGLDYSSITKKVLAKNLRFTSVPYDLTDSGI